MKNAFITSETGAIAIDWVVLTAGLIVVAIVGVSVVTNDAGGNSVAFDDATKIVNTSYSPAATSLFEGIDATDPAAYAWFAEHASLYDIDITQMKTVEFFDIARRTILSQQLAEAAVNLSAALAYAREYEAQGGDSSRFYADFLQLQADYQAVFN
jgi:hypothetical protein